MVTGIKHEDKSGTACFDTMCLLNFCTICHCCPLPAWQQPAWGPTQGARHSSTPACPTELTSTGHSQGVTAAQMPAQVAAAAQMRSRAAVAVRLVAGCVSFAPAAAPAVPPSSEVLGTALRVSASGLDGCG